MNNLMPKSFFKAMRQYQIINSKAVELVEIFDDSSVEILLNKVNDLVEEKDKLVLICGIEEFKIGRAHV